MCECACVCVSALEENAQKASETTGKRKSEVVLTRLFLLGVTLRTYRNVLVDFSCTIVCTDTHAFVASVLARTCFTLGHCVVEVCFGVFVCVCVSVCVCECVCVCV